MKYYLIAGEASGDMHAAHLMSALKQEDKSAKFRFFGGEQMQAAGGTMARHYRQTAFMGFLPVVLHLPVILRHICLCRRDIRRYHPDAVILVDYSGFNLRIAKYIKTRLHLPVFYYISPKIWAWQLKRIRQIRQYVDRMFCILPFEEAFYRKLQYTAATYVGNPTLDAIAQYKEQRAKKPDTFLHDIALPKKTPVIIALLPGSRLQEIKDNLPLMLQVAKAFPGCQAIIAGMPGIPPAFYDTFTQQYRQAKTVFNQTYPLLSHSAAALVTSGTATLETALFRVPQVVCYRTPLKQLSGAIFRRYFHTSYISLVNLIAEKEIVRELFAERLSEQTLRDELEQLLRNPVYRTQMLKGYDEVIRILGKPGTSQHTARHIVQYLRLHQSAEK